MKIVPLIALCTVLLAAGPAGAQKAAAPAAPAVLPQTSAATPMRPGLWENSIAIETAGSTTRRTIVSRACYTPADLADIARLLPKQREPGMKCENRDARAQGANATWQVACASPEGSLAGTAEMAVTATTYTGRAELERKKRGAKAEKVAETLAGKWLEACK
ncbi:MAG: DUF3617 family protein [Caldimonas sp.]